MYLAKEAEKRNIFQWGWENDAIVYFLGVEVLFPVHQYQNNTYISKILSKMYEHGVRGIHCKMPIFAGQRARPAHDRTNLSTQSFRAVLQPLM